MVNSIPLVRRFKVYFIYAIDLGYLLDEKDKEKLQSLRASASIQKELEKVFSEREASAWSFKNPIVEKGRIRDRAERAEREKGKNIWSDLFLEKQAPIFFDPITDLKKLLSSSNVNGWKEKVKFEQCELRIFKEGVFVLSFKFENLNLKINVDELISILAKLEDTTFEIFKYSIKQIIKESLSKKTHPFYKLSLNLRKDDKGLTTTIRTSAARHSCVFLEGLQDKEDDEKDSNFDEDTKRFLLGILNKTSWYSKYDKRYLDETFKKNVGYRKDEIYLTDKNATLILLKDYWTPGNPLRLYMDDLILAIQMQLAKQAHLNFFLQYMQSNPYSQKALKDPSSDAAVQLVLQSRNILTLLQESTDIDSLIVHGFTRKFLERLVTELKIDKYLSLIEDRIDNISSAIQLKSAREIGKQSIILNRLNIRLSIVGFILTTVNVIMVLKTTLNLNKLTTIIVIIAVSGGTIVSLFWSRLFERKKMKGS